MFKIEQTSDLPPSKIGVCLVNNPIVRSMENVELPALPERAYPSIQEKRDPRMEYSGRVFRSAIPLRTMRLSIFPLVRRRESQFVAIGNIVLNPQRFVVSGRFQRLAAYWLCSEARTVFSELRPGRSPVQILNRAHWHWFRTYFGRTTESIT